MHGAAGREASTANPIERIVVRVQVGPGRMAGTNDPVFLRLEGPRGREFRLQPRHGRGFQRGKENVFVLAAPDADDGTVAHAALNDPTTPAIPLDAVTGVRILKGQDPIPNVRGMGEMDDRLEVEAAEVELHGAGGGPPVRFARRGPIWLGLICGLSLELERLDEAS